MHTDDLSRWEHSHIFDTGNPEGERNTRLVVLITAIMMVFEITAGYIYNSMALLADGWHMSTHATALGLTAAAYMVARKYASDARFSFGTWKIEVLGGFTSAILLGMVALYIAAESVTRFLHPLAIRYDQALLVAAIGLLVNLVCAFLLRDHAHDHHDVHESHHAHKDLNLKSAYLHVVADAATSLFAIMALLGGKFFGWPWLDPAVGILGAFVIGIWSYGLIRDTGRILLDWRLESPMVREMYSVLESDGDTKISDLHIWQIGRHTYSCVLQLVASKPKSVQEYKAALNKYNNIGHLIIEIHEYPTLRKKLN